MQDLIDLKMNWILSVIYNKKSRTYDTSEIFPLCENLSPAVPSSMPSLPPERQGSLEALIGLEKSQDIEEETGPVPKFAEKLRCAKIIITQVYLIEVDDQESGTIALTQVLTRSSTRNCEQKDQRTTLDHYLPKTGNYFVICYDVFMF